MNKPETHTNKTIFRVLLAAVAVLILCGAVVGAAAAADTDDHSSWTKWTNPNSLPTSEGSYYLDTDVTITEKWSVPYGTTNLCLNGHVITMDGKDSAISVSTSRTLNLYDCNSANLTHNFKVDLDGPWTSTSDTATKSLAEVIDNPALLTDDLIISIPGGCIVGGSRNGNGGGVDIYSGWFNMCGGNIVGNSASGNGGGVFVEGGRFTMTGGNIVGNRAGTGGGVYAGNGGFTMSAGNIVGNSARDGGGACVSNSSSDRKFTLSGTAGIVGNRANRNGGGVYVSSNGTYDMNGGKIAGNRANEGGGVFVSADNTEPIYDARYTTSRFTMSAGSITKNHVNKNGGGVYVSSSNNRTTQGYGESRFTSIFTMNGGTITENSAECGGGVFVYSNETGAYSHCESTFEMYGGTIGGAGLGNTATQDGGGVFVRADKGSQSHTSSESMFKVSGKPIVTGNTKNNAANNVFLKMDKDPKSYITLTGTLQPGAEIRIVNPAGVGKFGVVDAGYTPKQTDAECFISDSTSPLLTAVLDTTVSPKQLKWETGYIITIDSSIQHGTVTSSSRVAKQGATVTLTATPDSGYVFEKWDVKDASSNPVTVTDNKFTMPGSAVTVTATFWKSWTVDPISDQIWTGSEIKPEVTARDGTKTLVKDTDYTVAYSDNINPGTAKVTVTGKGTYAGERTISFTIKKELDKCQFDSIPDQAWTGSEIKPEITVRDGDKILAENTDYTAVYTDNINTGTAKVTVTGIGVYSGTKAVSFEIKRGIGTCVISSIPDQTWSGSEIKPEITVRDGDKILAENTDYTAVYTDNINPGTAKVTVTGIGTYSGTKTVSFAIKKDLNKGGEISPIRSQAYTGEPVTPKVTVRDGENLLVKDIDYTVSYQNNIKIGTAVVIVEGKNRYKGTIQGNFSIIDPETACEISFVYEGKDVPGDILPETWAVTFDTEIVLPTDDEMKFSGFKFKGWRSEDLKDDDWIEKGKIFSMPDCDVTITGFWERMSEFDQVPVIEGTDIAYVNGGVADTNENVKVYVLAASNIKKEESTPSYLADYDVPDKPISPPSAAHGYTDFQSLAQFNIQAELNDPEVSSLLDIYVKLDDETMKDNIYLLQYNTSVNGDPWSSPIRPKDINETGYSGILEYVYEVDFYNTPFALVYEVPVRKSSGSSSSGGSSIWLTAAPTTAPTQAPAAEPTVVSTLEVPTVKPLDKPTPQATTPAPFFGILAGFSAAAVLFGLRRK
ncbi:MAG: hypothetical protein Q4Q20_04095 [Methanocorpusculum sp.]|nr:hypothetical protein [Methanocorpusculum sp.]